MSSTAAPAATTGLVGRRSELAVLGRALADGASGRGRLVLLTGDAGIGKTQLAEEVTARATATGWRLGWAGCVPGTAGQALRPWTAALRGLGHEWPGAGAPPVDVELVDGLAAALRAAAGEHPVLLVLDDLQWADPASVELLTLVAPLLRGMPVLALAAARTGAPAARGALRGPATVLHLTGLDAAEVAELHAIETGRAPTADAAAALHRRTGGNPLFVRELARTDPAAAALPAGVSEALGAALAELPRSTLSVLEPASVLDVEFDLGLLAAMLERTAQRVFEALEPARRARVLGHLAPDRARFAHELFREVLAESLGPVASARWHRCAAATLEASVGPGSPDRAVAARILHHACVSGVSGAAAARAARHALVVAGAAMTAREYAPAAAAAERGLALLSTAAPDAALQTELLLLSGDARHAIGEATAARAAYREAATLARSSGELALAVRAALGFAGGPVGFEVAMLDTEQVTLLSEVLDALAEAPAGTPPAGDALRARLAARLSVALSMTDAEPRRAALAAEAVVLARRAADPRALAEALAAHCDAVAGPEWSERRRAHAGEIVRVGETLGDPEVELLGRRLRLVALLELGDVVGAEAEIVAYARAAARAGRPGYDWYVPLWRAMQAHVVGARDRAEELLAQVDRIGTATGSTNAELLRTTSIVIAAVERADIARLDALFAAFPHDTPGLWVSVAASYVLAALDRRTEARARLDAVADALPAVPRDSEWLPMLTQAAETVAAVGGHPVAEWLREALTPFADRIVVEGIGAALRGSAHRHLGLLDAVLGHPERAAAHFAAAAEANTRLGAPLLAARAHRDAAVLLGDAEAAVRALALYTELDVPGRVAELQAFLGRSGPALPGNGSVAAAQLRRQGEVWTVRYAGREVRVRDTKGIQDLHRLLLAPGREVAAADLVHPDGSGVVQGDLGPLLDAPAATAYRRRLTELEQELAAADETGDAERSARAAAEHTRIVHELAAARGIGGRPRRTGGGGERARTAVRARIAYAIEKIERVHPDLGRHLRRSLRTGTYCVYEPETPVTWSG